MYFMKKIGNIFLILTILTGLLVLNSGGAAYAASSPTIMVEKSALKIGDTSLVTFTFSEAVTGFTLADLTVENGTLSSLSTSDNITWTATLTPAMGISNTTNLITLDNTGVENAAGNAGTGTTDSNNYAIDTDRPTATIVVANTALGAGQTTLVTITFSEAVRGFTLADLTVVNGTLSSLSTSDNITWTATLTPAAGILAKDNHITLDNTGVQDAAGNAGMGTTDSNNYAVDWFRPTATVVVAYTPLGAGQTSPVTITFSEAVTGFTNADLTVENGTLSTVSSSDGITWTATFTPNAGVNDTTNLITLDNSGVLDLAGNEGTGTTNSNNYAINTVMPTATIVVANSEMKIGDTSLVTFTFSEAVTGFTLADLTVENGTLSSLSTSDNITWTATLTPAAGISATTNLITLDNTGVANAAGNAGTGTTDSNNYAIDTDRPTATVVVANTALGAGQTTLVTITFSEAVTGFTNADLTVANGTLSTVSSSDGGITWTATFTPTAGIASMINLITLDNTGVLDLAGNAGTGTTTSSNYTINTVMPTATIMVANSALKIGDTSLVTFTFSEAVTGLTNTDLTVANGTLSAVSSSDGGITWTATFTPNAGVNDATNLITLDNTGVENAAGNRGIGTTDSNPYAIDTVRPTATVVVANTALGVGQTTLVTITFSEAVTGFTNADLTVANGTLSAVSSSDGGITWTATFTPTAGIANTTNHITLDNTGVQDLAGNAGTGTTDSNNYTINSVQSSSSGGGGGSSTPTDGKLTLPAGQSGQVSFGDAVTIFVPAGAANKELKLTTSKLLDTQNLLTSKQVLASSIYEIQKNFPEDVLKPVTLTFAFDPSNVKKDQRAAIFYYDETKKVWEEVTGGKTNGNRITVEVYNFMKYAVMVVDQPTDTTVGIQFSDIAGHWAEASIKQAVSKGIVTGYTDGTFRPNATVTRAEFAVMLMNVIKPQGDGAELNFFDTAGIGDWAKKAIAQAVQAGILKGYEDGSFRPNAEVTRAEMAVMLANALGQAIEAGAATGFADDKKIPAWAKDSVAYVQQAGVVKGNGNNQFVPQGHTTRAEAVTVLLNMLAHMNK
ncbi:Ig-like domain-containing protein [Paenibacillus sp. NPDC058071]|uniref:Ig-like domain-containing protein n=1 Tax=Paenibacillus sp. NPDC058071 TaxID=3346326 RepID=UPI0036DDFF1E